MQFCKYPLNGPWLMRREGDRKWEDAIVPGSVYGDLLRLGKIEDPFFGENEAAALSCSNQDYEYEKTFSPGKIFSGCDRIFLCCGGLDTLCQIYLNGKKVAETCNMHRRYEIDVTGILKEKENTLRMLFRSPLRYAERMGRKKPLVNGARVCPEGVSYLRKAHYMFGWDWGPALPDMGIWRGISLCGYRTARIADWSVRQTHGKNGVRLSLSIGIIKYSRCRVTVSAALTSPDGKFLRVKKETAASSASLTMDITEPRYWWPNGMGDHPLYLLKIAVEKDGTALDSREARIGLRTVRLVQKKDRWGKSFCLSVNGKELFAMGADYIPEDNILSRCSRDRTEKLIKSCARSHFNLLRVWGGGVYPEDYFYDLCDEHGILIWQDFMFACGVYDFSPSFRENVGAEIVDNLRRIRHHACLALLCGNNEQEWEWLSDGRFLRADPERKADYIRQFETFMPELARRYAPDIPYWCSSPSSGGSFRDPNGESAGDMHDWEVWHGLKPYSAYRDIKPRFLSEFGIGSFPCLKTVQSFANPEECNPFSPVMEAHQKDPSGNAKILYYISQSFRYPRDFDSLLYVSQLAQAEGIRCGVEHLRRLRGRCMGTVYWQLNDCWPAPSWSSIDYFGRWKVLQYEARRFYAPVLVSALEKGTKVALSVTNDTGNSVSGILSWELRTQEGEKKTAGSLKITVPAFASRQCSEADFEKYLPTEKDRRSSYLRYGLASGGKPAGGGTVLFVPPKYFSFTNPHLRVSAVEEKDRFLVKISAQAFARFVELDLKDADAVFSDNYFDLSAGEEREISVRKEDLSAPLTFEQFREKLKVRSLYDTLSTTTD